MTGPSHAYCAIQSSASMPSIMLFMNSACMHGEGTAGPARRGMASSRRARCSAQRSMAAAVHAKQLLTGLLAGWLDGASKQAAFWSRSAGLEETQCKSRRTRRPLPQQRTCSVALFSAQAHCVTQIGRQYLRAARASPPNLANQCCQGPGTYPFCPWAATTEQAGRLAILGTAYGLPHCMLRI